MSEGRPPRTPAPPVPHPPRQIGRYGFCVAKSISTVCLWGRIHIQDLVEGCPDAVCDSCVIAMLSAIGMVPTWADPRAGGPRQAKTGKWAIKGKNAPSTTPAGDGEMPVHCPVWKKGVPAHWAPGTSLTPVPGCPWVWLKGLSGCLPIRGAHNLQVVLP